MTIAQLIEYKGFIADAGLFGVLQLFEIASMYDVLQIMGSALVVATAGVRLYFIILKHRADKAKGGKDEN